MSAPAMYTLELASGSERFEITEKALLQIGTLRGMLEIGLTEEARSEPIPIQHDVPCGILREIVAWCEHHKNDVITADEEEESVMEIPEWDRQFLAKVEKYTDGLYDMTVAANYLAISKLYRFACKFIYDSHVRGKTTEEIRDYFGETDDFTPEEKAQLEEENKWFN